MGDEGSGFLIRGASQNSLQPCERLGFSYEFLLAVFESWAVPKGLSGIGFEAQKSDIYVGLTPDQGKRIRYQARDRYCVADG